jgi:hypothetical protein
MPRHYKSGKNGNCEASDTQTYYAEFVKNHRTTLNYLKEHGNVMERAKAELLFVLAGS